MKTLRQLALAVFAILALTAAAEQPDPVVTSIGNAYKQAKVSIKKNKAKGNEMVTTFNYTVKGKGKSYETIHFFYTTAQGTFAMMDEGEDPHFYYYPLNFVTRYYNIGKQKYYEEYLFDPESERLLFALTKEYDDNGKPYYRRYYLNEGSVYKAVGGPAVTSFDEACLKLQADDLLHSFNNLIRNPKE